MKILVEVSWRSDDVYEDGEPKIERGYYFLLHWGMTYQIIENVAVNYTIGICQNIDTGQIEIFRPEQLKIIGEDISKIR